jgi:cytochrome P450
MSEPVVVMSSLFEQFQRTTGLGADAFIITAIIAFAAALLMPLLTLFRRRRSRGYPTPPGGLPFFGHALSLMDTDEITNVMTEWAEEFGRDRGVYEFRLFGQRWVVLCGSDAVMQAMRLRPHRLRRPSNLPGVFSSLGINGVFSAEGHQWSIDRRVVAPALNRNRLEEYFPYIKMVAGRLASKWEGGDGVVSSGFSDLERYALDITALSILGMDFDSLNDATHRLASDIRGIFHIMEKRVMSPVPYWKLPLLDNLIDGGRDTSGRVMETLRGLVRKYKEQKDDGALINYEQEQTKRDRKIFLHDLIDMSDGVNAKLDGDRVAGNLATLILAGTDTTSGTLAACLWEIANDLELQNELHRDISHSEIDLENLAFSDVMNGFPRLYSLLYEVLRLKGPGPAIYLEPAERIEIQGELIEPGTMIVAMLRTFGEMAASEIPTGPKGEGPEQFCPLRWLIPQNSTSGRIARPLAVMHPSNKHCGFMPFGHGVRVCPGAQLAKIEVITGLFCILQKFEISPIPKHPPIRIVSRFTEKFDGEIQLILKPRI